VSAAAASDDTPLYLHVGFSGSRRLFDAGAHGDIDAKAFEDALVPLLAEQIRQACADLKVAPHHALCGLSQVAVGGDFAFTRACARLGAVQCIVLPQPLDDYLAAVSPSTKQPDFTGPEADRARELAGSEHVISTRVASVASGRDERLDDTNLEIVDTSDLMVCLFGDDAGKRGGAAAAMQFAMSRDKPVLALDLAVHDGRPVLTRRHPPPEASLLAPALQQPVAPKLLSAAGPLHATLSIQRVKDRHSEIARSRQRSFRLGAAAIILSHMGATAAAAGALALHGLTTPGLLPWILGFELILLAWGWWSHHRLHASHAAPEWAEARLIAEAAASAAAMGSVHVALAHLRTLPFPLPYQPMLRSLNTQHLRDSRARAAGQAVAAIALAYVRERLGERDADGRRGQWNYYDRQASQARFRLRWVVWPTFYVTSGLAILSTLLKFLMVLPWPELHAWLPGFEQLEHAHDAAERWMGFFAVVLPLVAAAALSYAAAHDLEARASTYRDMAEFLALQRQLLLAATSRAELARLMLETEYRLVGETVTWYARRRFTSVP